MAHLWLIYLLKMVIFQFFVCLHEVNPFTNGEHIQVRREAGQTRPMQLPFFHPAWIHPAVIAGTLHSK
jgi:hypothetical protein